MAEIARTTFDIFSLTQIGLEKINAENAAEHAMPCAIFSFACGGHDAMHGPLSRAPPGRRCGCGGTGRRTRFRFWRQKRGGSSPSTRTIFVCTMPPTNPSRGFVFAPLRRTILFARSRNIDPARGGAVRDLTSQSEPMSISRQCDRQPAPMPRCFLIYGCTRAKMRPNAVRECHFACKAFVNLHKAVPTEEREGLISTSGKQALRRPRQRQR